MTRMRPAASLLAALLASVLLAGCGGFGSSVPEELPPRAIKKYVAIGDGFTAAPYVGTMDRARGCLRSKRNYPALVAERLGAALTDVSCTGATSASALNGGPAPVGKAILASQLDAVTTDTDLVTVSVGISDNDLLVRNFFVCVELPCTNRIGAQQLSNEIDAVGNNVDTIVRQIQIRAPKAFIVVVGYPQITSPTKTCRGVPSMTAQELAGVDALFTAINRKLQNAALTTGNQYADLAAVSKEHDMCATDPWVRGTDPKEGERAALHPLAPEQQAAAEAVLAAVAQR